MNEFLAQSTIWVAATVCIYFLALKIYQKTRWIIAHPVLISIAVIIVLLKFLHVDFKTYNLGGNIISFFLGPSVVALGVLLYEKYDTIKKNWKAFLLTLIIGSLTGILSVVSMALWLGSSDEVVKSLAPKSVTTPIAIEIVKITGGLPSLTAVVVILVGIFGAAFGPLFLKWIRIKSVMAFGLAMGAASHGIGTARALEEGGLPGAVSAMAMCLNGVFTAVFTPLILPFLHV